MYRLLPRCMPMHYYTAVELQFSPAQSTKAFLLLFAVHEDESLRICS